MLMLIMVTAACKFDPTDEDFAAINHVSKILAWGEEGVRGKSDGFSLAHLRSCIYFP
jgi:hypothetical protein